MEMHTICLVEDEKDSNALLSSPALHSERGLAWWGRKYGTREDEIGPITDEDEINEIQERGKC